MVRQLSKELQKKAIEELNEDPERVEEDIKTIQDWIERQPYLNAPTDKQWILGFLRGSKFSLQTTKDKLDTFYSIKRAIPATMVFRSVYSADIQAVFKTGILLPLPDPENYIGPKIILLRYQDCDTNIITIELLVLALYMILNILMVEDDNIMISGLILWNDMTQFPLSFMLQLSPKLMNHFFTCMQKGFPLRLKGLHYSGSPTVAKTCFNFFKSFLGPKLRDRVVFYDEGNFTHGNKILTEKIVPIEYGGVNSSVNDIAAYWKNKIESYNDWFMESNQYGTDESKRSGKPRFDDVIGVDGSFRKLNVD